MIESIVPKAYLSSVEGLSTVQNTDYPLMPFGELTISFFNHLSRAILKHPDLRITPAFAALGFWLRKSNLKKILKENQAFIESSNYRIEPLGLVFHVCPSNVDTMFFYSLVISMLAGNKNIVRISSKLDHPLMFDLFDLVNKSLNEEDFKVFENYINIVKYERNDEINGAISLNSDGRIIWGGDETVRQFKSYETKPKVKDLFFADRVSYSLLKSEIANDLSEDETSTLIQNLYNDIYTFDQKGCSSPHCLFLLGDKDQNNIFLKKAYKLISKYAEKNYDTDIGSIATFKFNQITEDIIDSKIESSIHDNNYLVLSELRGDTVPETCGTGYLYFVHLGDLSELKKYINRKIQSVGYYGLSDTDLDAMTQLSYAKGVDRIIPIGQALDFDYIWDGYNILTEMVSLKTVR